MPFTSRNIVLEMFSTKSQAMFSGGRSEKIKLSGGVGLPRKLLPLRLSKAQRIKALLSHGDTRDIKHRADHGQVGGTSASTCSPWITAPLAHEAEQVPAAVLCFASGFVTAQLCNLV